MRLLSASLILAYEDGSHLFLALPLTDLARRPALPPFTAPGRGTPLDPDVNVLLAEFFGQRLRRIPFLTHAQSATRKTREGFFRGINDLGRTRYDRLTRTQKAVLEELHDFHCASQITLDETDLEHYLETEGGE
jgi:hypothetical protein